MAALSAAAAVLAALAVGGVAAATGLPGSGKTTTVEEALDAAPWGLRAGLFDPYAIRDRRNWDAGHRERKPWWLGKGVPVFTLDELLRRPALLDKARCRVIVAGTSGTLEPARLGRDFSTLAGLLWHTGNFALLGEET